MLVMYHNALAVRGTQKGLDSDAKELKHISIQQPGPYWSKQTKAI